MPSRSVRPGRPCLVAAWIIVGAVPAAAGTGTIRVAAFGDYGEDSSAELAVSVLVGSLTVDAIITLGDNSYDNTPIDENIGKYYADWIGDYVGAYGPGSPVNRFFPSLGNHDYSDGAGVGAYLGYFTLPGDGIQTTNTSGNERYYDFILGPVHFFPINSNGQEPDGDTSGSVQGQWLQAQLAASTAPWKIVYFHHPPYSSGDHGNEENMQWPYQAWGATAVLSGHDHDYERVVLDEFPYLVAGTGGRSLRDFGPPVEGSVVRYNDDYGTVVITADSSSITFEFWSIAGGGTLIDTFTLVAPAPGPDIAVSPPAHDFGAVEVGSSATVAIVVRNVGTADLSVTSSVISGPDATEFAIEDGAAPFTLAPGESTAVTVGFAPVTAGAKNAVLELVSNDPDEGLKAVPLAGFGFEAGAYVRYEEHLSGTSSGSATVQTSGSFAGEGGLYLAAVASKPYEPVTGVSGLGVPWTSVQAQCAGRGQTGVDVWMTSQPVGGGVVAAAFSSAPSNAVIVVSRYSGVDGTDPLGAVVSANTNGSQGPCSGGSDDSSYSLDLATTAPGAVVFGATAMRNRQHGPGSGYTEREEIHAGAGGNEASAATVDQRFDTLGTVVLDGSFSGSVDWAVVGVELRPGSPNATAVPAGSTPLALRPARPNPFRESTAIEYVLPIPAAVDLVIYDVTGREIRRLARGLEPPGARAVTWNGRDAAGLPVGSGVYFARLRAGPEIRIQKLVLAR